MNPWKELGIEPCADVRLVKRAYAKKLKQTRPDEKPAEFQALHKAYKQALYLAERRTEVNTQEVIFADEPIEAATPSGYLQPSDGLQRAEHAHSPEHSRPLTQDVVEQAVHRSKEEVPAVQLTDVEANEPAPESNAATEQENKLRQKAIEDALTQVDKVLQNDRLISLESNWRFLAEIPYLLEDDFNRELGFHVFKRVAVHNARVGKYPLVTANILYYCDRIFGWQGQRWLLSRRVSQPLCDKIFVALEEFSERIDPVSALRGGAKLIKQKARQVIHDLESYYFAGILTRALALLLDCFLVYIFLNLTVGVVMIKGMGKAEDEITLLIAVLTAPGYLLMAWIMESSPWQATLGKRLFGYKVTNRRFDRLGYLHGFARVISFMLTLPLGKIGWLINCFLGGNLMHDRLSRTYVIDIRKSQKEYQRDQ